VDRNQFHVCLVFQNKNVEIKKWSYLSCISSVFVIFLQSYTNVELAKWTVTEIPTKFAFQFTQNAMVKKRKSEKNLRIPYICLYTKTSHAKITTFNYKISSQYTLQLYLSIISSCIYLLPVGTCSSTIIMPVTGRDTNFWAAKNSQIPLPYSLMQIETGCQLPIFD
jgi:hypothetical protein